MSALDDLLTRPPVIVAAGADALADALVAQGVDVTTVDWRPPVAAPAAVAALAAEPRVQEANQEALARILAVRPEVVDVVPAHQVMPALDERTFFHAGPPVTWDSASGPLRGAIIGALIYEGQATSPEAAEALAASGEVRLEPCHHHNAVGPMAGVISRSMPVYVVRDRAGDGVAYATLNEGLGKVLRYGAFGPEVIDRLRWMQRVLGPVVGAALRRGGPVDLMALIANALQMGDDGHNRNRAGTSMFARAVGPSLIEADELPSSDRAAAFRFIDGNDHTVLNLVMAAAKLMVSAAAHVPGSSLVVTMARNGTEFGVRLAGTGERWFTAPAPVVDGLYLGSYTAADANPDIGDSAITETVGLGGFSMAASPAIVGVVGGSAAGAIERTLAMYEITLTEHPSFQIPILESRGVPFGIDATRVVRTGLRPQINTGLAGRVPGTGMVGAGLVEAPMACFVQAVEALAEALR
ncbi:DUF1116 domain-containing protein [Haliangium sp.]|uniref:DUF1116 domain-containing protein n=1 Tax=Haliangium sp. TaxID=2663208 RepID=UPI003D0BEEE8